MYGYELIRSKRKTLSIEIRQDGSLLVRAPLRLAKRYIDEFVLSKSKWIDTHIKSMQQRLNEYPEPNEFLRKYCIDRAREYLPERLEYYSHIMKVQYNAVTITGAKSRFGSCSANDRLSFSWRVMLYPDECIDYVVVHELAHIRYKNHGAEFYAFIESVMPDHKKRRAGLRGAYRKDLPKEDEK